MFNVRKSIIAILASAAVATAAVSCDNTKKERAEAAQDLLTKAEALVGAHKYDSAMVLLDTLDRSYRDCLEQRKAAQQYVCAPWPTCRATALPLPNCSFVSLKPALTN